eukprot:scaffold881_cov123-Isochrysis_galbana.AAC.15
MVRCAIDRPLPTHAPWMGPPVKGAPPHSRARRRDTLFTRRPWRQRQPPKLPPPRPLRGRPSTTLRAAGVATRAGARACVAAPLARAAAGAGSA